MPVPFEHLSLNEQDELSWRESYDLLHGVPEPRIACEADVEFCGKLFHIAVIDIPDHSHFGLPIYGRRFSYQINGRRGFPGSYDRADIALSAARTDIV